MSIRRNNLQGHDSKYTKHGLWTKRKTYRNTGFRQVPDLSIEERQKAIEEKLKPYKLDLSKHIVVEAAHGPVGEVVPPTPPVEVIIAPTGVTQYENVVLTATTTGTSPTFIWTLTDFYDVSGNTITSFTGSVVTEGYFISTGSSNVSVSMTCDEGSGSSSEFVVSEFTPDSITDLMAWIDFSDDSTITYRTGTNYIESIEEKTGKWTISQTTASYQPLMLTGGSVDSTTSLQVAQFDGIDNFMRSNIITPTITPTAHTSFTLGTNKTKTNPSTEEYNRGAFWEFHNGAPNLSLRRSFVHRPDLEYLLGIGYAFKEDSNITYNSGFTSYPLVHAVRTDDSSGGSMVVNGNSRTGFWSSTAGWEVQQITISNQGNQGGTDTKHKLWGEYWESLHYTRTLTTNEISLVERYLGYKWFDFTPTISGSLTPTQYEDVTYSVENVAGYDITADWIMPTGWVGPTTGSSITGYFSGTTGGDINVQVSNGYYTKTASATVSSVTAFDPLSTSPDLWYDMSDSTTMTLRTGTDYIESINDKSGNAVTLSQTTASYQPLYSASSVNPTLSAATFDGIDNWIHNISNPQVSSITGQTTLFIGQVKDKSGLPGVGTGNQLDGDAYNLFGGTSNITNRRHLQRAGGGTNWLHNYYYQTQRYQLVSTVDGGNDKIISIRRENNTTIDEATINGVELTISSTSQARTYDGGSIRFGTMNDLTNNYAQKLYGEVGEFLHFNSTISDSDLNALNRYLQYKWLGGMIY